MINNTSSQQVEIVKSAVNSNTALTIDFNNALSVPYSGVSTDGRVIMGLDGGGFSTASCGDFLISQYKAGKGVSIGHGGGVYAKFTHEGKTLLNATASNSGDLLQVNGTISCSGGTVNVYSDSRIKENIVDCNTENAISRISSLRIREYNHIENFRRSMCRDRNITNTGIIVQELEETAYSDLCFDGGDLELRDKINERDNPQSPIENENGILNKPKPILLETITNIKRFNSDKIIWDAIKCVQYLLEENTALKERITIIENLLEGL